MLKAPGKSAEHTGTRILLEAMSRDKVHLARFVLDASDGEIVDWKSDGSQTPLISSILLPDSPTRCKFAELLLRRGAAVNRQDARGRTALSHACERGHLDAVKVLVRHNADPEVVDRWGNTALMYAAGAGHLPVVEFLVRAFKRLGLQIDRQNKVGQSAVEVAKLLGHTDCMFALSYKKSRDSAAGAQRKVGHLMSEFEALQMFPHSEQPRPRFPSVGSIEELSSFGSQGLVFSGVLTPKPPLRTSEDHLPPLTRRRDSQKPLFSSPRPSRNAPSTLGSFLTHRPESELGNEKIKELDFGTRRFHGSYFEKRCSVPTGILSPTPPERTLLPLPKSRSARRREAEATTFSVLSNKLLRRFTSPEFKKAVRDQDEEDEEEESARIPRSQTFPQGLKHPQVASKASIDSISAVRCEFDSKP